MGLKTIIFVCFVTVLSLYNFSVEVAGEINHFCPRLISRQQWQSQFPQEPLKPTEKWTKVKIVNSPIHANCTNIATCSKLMRDLQKLHQLSWDLADVEYNFCIGGDRRIFQGTGFMEAYPKRGEQPSTTMTVCLLGDYRFARPTKRVLLNLLRFLDCSHYRKFLTDDYTISVPLKTIFQDFMNKKTIFNNILDRVKFNGENIINN